jgi:hypothetical protein
MTWAFPSHQGMVVPLKNEFTYCYPMIFGISVYWYVNLFFVVIIKKQKEKLFVTAYLNHRNLIFRYLIKNVIKVN